MKKILLGLLVLIPSLCLSQGQITRPKKNESTKEKTSNQTKTSKSSKVDASTNPVTYNILNSPQLKISRGYFQLTKIEIYPSKTIVYTTFYPEKGMRSGEFIIWSNEDTYFENIITKQKLYIKESDIGFSIFQGYELKNDKPYTFKEIFPPVPQDWIKINFVTDNAYILKDFNLK